MADASSPSAAFPALEGRLARPAVERWLVLSLALLACGLRVVHVLASRESPLFAAPQMDALYHVEWARALAAGHEYQDGPYFRAPLYPWLLGLLFAACGDGLLLPRLLQAGLGAVGTVLVYLIGRRVFDRATGALAALLLATHWISIFYDGELLLESLATPLYLGALWASLGLVRGGTVRAGLAAGLLFGLSAICRPNVLLFLPPFLLYLAWARRAALGRGGGARVLAALCLGSALPIAPVAALNLAEGDRVLISYQAGVNFWIGNNPASDGSSAIAPGTRADWWGGFEDTHADAEAAEGRALRPSEVSRHYFRRSFEAIAADPGRWLSLLLFKLRLFLMNWELGNNEEPYFLVERFSPLLAALPVGFAALLGLGLLGMFVRGVGPNAAERRGMHAVLIGFTAIYSLSVVLFFVNARFRLPVLPVLMVYAAHGALWVLGELRARRFLPAVLGLACALGIGLASRALVPSVVPRNAASNGRLILAQETLRAGDAAAAQELFEAALDLWPSSPIALEGLGAVGRARFEAGDFEAAAAAFARLADARPRDFEASFSLGRAELEAGRPGPALEAFERALELPEPAAERFLYEAYGRAVTLREAGGEPALALEQAERMLARFPEDPVALAVVARLRAQR